MELSVCTGINIGLMRKLMEDERTFVNVISKFESSFHSCRY